MVLLIKLIGLLILAMGLAICASPAFMKKISDFFFQGKNIYYAGAIRAAAGGFLLLGASQSKLPLAAAVLGILFLLSAAVIFVTGAENMKNFIRQYLTLPQPAIRILGLVAACFGLLILVIF